MSLAKITKILPLSLCFLVTLVLAGCLTKPYMRHEVAKRVAGPAFMVKRVVPASPFAITVFERMHKRYETANIYIEGDGLNWLSPSRKSLDPTPNNPIALHVAAHDDAKNVAWIARPCQYSKLLNKEKACDDKYWTNSRYGTDVLKSMNKTLDEMKRRWNLEGFNLVGFSGGGAIAAILAATRDDVLSLRTIAGNLDHKVHSQVHDVTQLHGSLNAIDFANKLKDIPQRHFIGGQDEIVPPAILYSYLQAIGSSSCVNYTLIQENEHESGWTEKWPELLEEPVTCTGPRVEKSFEMEQDLEPVYLAPRPLPSKP